MDINTLMASVINTQSGNSFYRFSNTDGKVWLMPAKNMQVAMTLALSTPNKVGTKYNKGRTN